MQTQQKPIIDLSTAKNGDRFIMLDDCAIERTGVYIGEMKTPQGVGYVHGITNNFVMTKQDGSPLGNYTCRIVSPAPRKLSGWMNVYRYEEMDAWLFSYESKEMADECAEPDRLACIDLSQFEEGHGL